MSNVVDLDYLLVIILCGFSASLASESRDLISVYRSDVVGSRSSEGGTTSRKSVLRRDEYKMLVSSSY